MFDNLLKNCRLRLFTLLVSSFLSTSLFALTISSQRLGYLKRSAIEQSSTLGVSTEIVQASEVQYPKYVGGEIFDISAKSSLAIDVDTGAVLYEKQPQVSVMPASTSKIITALVSLDVYDLKKKVVVPSFTIEGQVVGLKSGEVISVNDLLYALLVDSANDAAEALARNYPGGRDIFVAEMNLKARNLGLTSSIFLNPTGLDQIGQSTTAQDLVKASFYAMQNPVFEKIVETKNYVIRDENNNVRYRFTNTNQLLGEVDGVKGVKTGKTDGAMENLITYIERGNAKVLIAVLGSDDRFRETKRLINWLFTSYVWGN